MTTEPFKTKAAHRKVEPPFRHLPAGMCRWCGQQVYDDDGQPSRRKGWHSKCAKVYRGTWPGVWRRKIEERDQGVCAVCPPGTPAHGEWDADHIVTLIDGGDWSLENGQTLCRPHHREKTSRENAARAPHPKPPP